MLGDGHLGSPYAGSDMFQLMALNASREAVTVTSKTENLIIELIILAEQRSELEKKLRGGDMIV